MKYRTGTANENFNEAALSCFDVRRILNYGKKKKNCENVSTDNLMT